MDISNSDSVKNKGISELHFNAINNSTNARKATTSPSSSSDDQKKLLPSNTKYFITSAATTINNATPTSSNKAYNNGVIHNQSDMSSALPSSTTSPIESPTPIYPRPKHFNSMRSVRSGMITFFNYTVVFCIDFYMCFFFYKIDRRSFSYKS